MQGGDVMRDELIIALAKKYGKTPAQIVLRWDIEIDAIVIPKSTHKERIVENMGIFDFALEADDIAAINALNKDFRTGPDPYTFSRR